MDELENEEPWLRGRIANVRSLMSLVPQPQAQARLQALAAAMEGRLVVLECRRLHPLHAAEDMPGG
jgi:hypothetical protein